MLLYASVSASERLWFFTLLSLSLQRGIYEALWLISFRLTFFYRLPFLSVLIWLLCIIYCILSKLSMYLIEFTSKLYFTSTWVSCFFFLYIPSSVAIMRGYWRIRLGWNRPFFDVREMTAFVCLLTIAMLVNSKTIMYSFILSQRLYHIVELSTQIVILLVALVFLVGLVWGASAANNSRAGEKVV